MKLCSSDKHCTTVQLNYGDHRPTNEFLDSLVSSFLLPYILQPTRLSKSKTLINNIFCNLTSHKVISGNKITRTISDHLPQFLRSPNVFSNISSNKSKVFERSWSNFNQENFILDYFSID